tara:strand:- start:169 stop:642 length:474 start_codon:yes stop_codon:yes gene_type:complete
MSLPDYTPCPVQLRFNIQVSSPLSWPEFFGFESGESMLQDFLSQHLASETLSFLKVDTQNAERVAIFSTKAGFETLSVDHEKALGLLMRLSVSPNYNQDPDRLLHMKVALLQEKGIVIPEGAPASDLYEAFNSLTYGFASYREKMNNIATRNKADAA